jgi:hypothetical protein
MRARRFPDLSSRLETRLVHAHAGETMAAIEAMTMVPMETWSHPASIFPSRLQ